jgi:hypothetical protein
LRHFLTGPLKEALLLPMGPYRVEERLRRAPTASIFRVGAGERLSSGEADRE